MADDDDDELWEKFLEMDGATNYLDDYDEANSIRARV